MDQELTFPSLQKSSGVGEGGELRNDLPPIDEATILPSQPSELQQSSEPKRKGLRSTVAKRNVQRPVKTLSELQESSEPKRKGLRSTVAKRNVQRPVKTKNVDLPARSRRVRITPRGAKSKQLKRRDKIDPATQDAPSISPSSPPTESVHCDNRYVDSAGSQVSEPHLGLSSLHPGPPTNVPSEVKLSDLIQVPRLEKPDTQIYRRCSSEAPVPLRVELAHQGCRTSLTSIPTEAQSGDVGNRPDTRSWACHFPTHVVEASSPRNPHLPAAPSSAQHSNLVLDNQYSTNLPSQKMSDSKGLTGVTAVVESTEANPKPGESTSCCLETTGSDRLLVGKRLLEHKEVQIPRHSTMEALDCIPTSEDYNTIKRNLVASENTYKRLSVAYQEFHKSNTIAHQRASNAESELKRLKKELNRLQKENTEYKANHDRVKRQAKRKNHQAVVEAQGKSPIALGAQGDFDNAQKDLQSPEISTTESSSKTSHSERPIQDPSVGAWIGPPLSVINTKEPCIPEMEGVDACSGQTDLEDLGELGKGIDDLDWGDMDPMEFQMACDSMFENVPELLPL